GVEESVRIMWVTGTGTSGFVSLPYVDERYMCYFSDSDPDSICGPVPFRESIPGGMTLKTTIDVFDKYDNNANKTVSVEVGGIKLTPEVTFNDDNVTMLVYVEPATDSSVTYKILDSNFEDVTSGYIPLKRITGTPYFSGHVDLDPAVYYIAFQAESTTDFGGGIIKADMLSGGDIVTSGVLQADPIDLEIMVSEGSQPSLPTNKRICNTHDTLTFTGVTVSLPTGFSNHISITPASSEIKNDSCVFYTISLSGISQSLDIDTIAELRSNGTKYGELPIKMKISYAGSTSVTDCSGLSDGTNCLGGICCSGTCQRIECCTSSDCTSGTCSSNRCSSGGTDTYCTVGTCVTSAFTCPDGQEETGSCTSGGSSGICCATSGTVDECYDKYDLEECSSGICCSGECLETIGTDCCTDFDCIGDQTCDTNNLCIGGGGGGGEGFDMTLIIIIAVIAIGAGIGIYFFFIKKKGKSSSDEFEDKKDDDVFDEEEFY
ncbi:MAG: hypothetical protein ABIH52_04630, partial [Candidatus Aenigmatarchaeota archaeon]